MSVAERSNYVSGKKFEEFLREHNVTAVELKDGTKTLSFNSNLSVWRVDKILTPLGMSIHMLPDDAWMPEDYTPHSHRINATEN